MNEPTIREALAAKGIEVRGTGLVREFWRGTQLLGHYSALQGAVQFLDEEQSA